MEVKYSSGPPVFVRQFFLVFRRFPMGSPQGFSGFPKVSFVFLWFPWPSRNSFLFEKSWKRMVFRLCKNFPWGKINKIGTNISNSKKKEHFIRRIQYCFTIYDHLGQEFDPACPGNVFRTRGSIYKKVKKLII